MREHEVQGYGRGRHLQQAVRGGGRARQRAGRVEEADVVGERAVHGVHGTLVHPDVVPHGHLALLITCPPMQGGVQWPWTPPSSRMANVLDRVWCVTE